MEIDFLFLAGAGYCRSLPLAMLLDALKQSVIIAVAQVKFCSSALTFP
jgi:hypothetical protein